MTIAPRPSRPGKLLGSLYDHIKVNQPITFAELADVSPFNEIDRRVLSKTLSNSVRRGYFVVNKDGYAVASYEVYKLARKREALSARPAPIVNVQAYSSSTSALPNKILSEVHEREQTDKSLARATRAPRPMRVTSYYNKIYDVLEACITPVRVEEIYKLLPAALMGQKTMPTRKRLRNILLQATYDGYFLQENIKGHEVYSIASRSHYDRVYVVRAKARTSALTRGTDKIHNAVKPTRRLYVAFVAGVALSFGLVAIALWFSK